MNVVAIAFLVVVYVVLIALVLLLLAFPFMWVWNYAVVSALTIAAPLTYWKSFALMIFMSAFVLPGRVSSRK